MGLTLRPEGSGLMPDGVSATEMRGGVLTIGRRDDNDLVLPDPDRHISSQHCVIEQRGNDYFITDNSTNGTVLNHNQTLTRGQAMPLNPGDVITLGQYELRVQIDDPLDPGLGAPDPYADLPPPLEQGSYSQPVQSGHRHDANEDLDDPLGAGGEDDLLGILEGPATGAAVRGGNRAFIPDDPLGSSAGAFGGSDPFAGPSDPLAKGGDPMAELGASDGGALLPGDADPLSPGGANEDEWLAGQGARSDHAASTASFYGGPKQAGNMIPDDFDSEFGGGDDDFPLPDAPAPPPTPAPAAPPQAAPDPLAQAELEQPLDPFSSPAPSPSPSPAPVDAEPENPFALGDDPVAEPAPAPAPAPAPVTPPRPRVRSVDEPSAGAQPQMPPASAEIGAPEPALAPTAPSAPAVPSASGAVSDAAARAFLRAAGAGDVAVSDAELVETMERLGRAFGTMVEGLREVLMTRSSIKDEFRMNRTQIQAGGNNPLKFSVSPEQALEAMVRPAVRGYMKADEAADGALKDIKAHEVATISGMQAAFKSMLNRLDPKTLEGRLEAGGGLGSLLSGKKARYWEVYEKMYGEIARDAEDDFHSLFGEEFARAYQEQLRKL